MTEEELFARIAVALSKRENPLPEPTPDDWAKIRALCDCDLDTDFIHFINLLSGYNFRIMEAFVGVDLSETDPEWNRTFGVSSIVQAYVVEFVEYPPPVPVTERLIPFLTVGNGDLYCMVPNDAGGTSVAYFDHEDYSLEILPGSFRDWLLSEVQEYEEELSTGKTAEVGYVLLSTDTVDMQPGDGI